MGHAAGRIYRRVRSARHLDQVGPYARGPLSSVVALPGLSVVASSGWVLMYTRLLTKGGDDDDVAPDHVSGSSGAPPGPDDDDDYTDHPRGRADEASGDPNRQVGDANRVIREGKAYRDTETGATVHVGKGGRAVVQGRGGRVTQFKVTKKQVQSRVQSGRWEPIGGG